MPETVTEISPLEIERIALGVRFEPRFEIFDNVGKTVDSVLRSAGTPFGPSVFPQSQSTPTKHHLTNEDSENSLRFSHQDAILDFTVNTRNIESIEKLAAGYEDFVLAPLRDAGLRGIQRYGILFRLAECGTLLHESPVRHYLGEDFDSANSLQLRFTRRLPVMEAVAKKDINDFKNAIYSVEQTDEGSVSIQVDYQEYFDPVLDASAWKSKPYGKFADRGVVYLLGEFQDWLAKLRRDQAA